MSDLDLTIPKFLKRKKGYVPTWTPITSVKKTVIAEPKPKQQKTVSVKDRMTAKARGIAGEIDYLYDNVVWNFETTTIPSSDEIFDILKKQEVSGPVADITADILETHLFELKEIPKDKELQEAYSAYGTKDLEKFVSFYEMAIGACRQFNENAKRQRVRKPRKRGRVVNAERKLRTFKHLAEYTDWQIASVNPENILRASEVWLYVTKYRELKVARAIDRGGLDIKGTTIINVDESKSVAKRLRQNVAQEIVKEITTVGKRKANNLFKTAKGSEPKATFRTNDNTLILAVFK